MIRSPLLALLFAALAAAAPAAAQRQDEMAVGPNITLDDFRRAGLAPQIARRGADVTLVYFHDYACGVCRRYTAEVARVVEADRRLRVISRDTPILGEGSRHAARAAIAASFQGKYWAMHHALMRAPLPLDEAAIRGAASVAKVDWSRLQRDLVARVADIDAQIERNLDLHAAAGLRGTPGFLIGNRLADGALDGKTLAAEIARQRRSTRSPSPR